MANGELKIDVAPPWATPFKAAGVEADVPNDGRAAFVFANPGNGAEAPATFEAACAEESALPKAEDDVPKGEEEELPNAEPEPKLLLPPKTFDEV